MLPSRTVPTKVPQMPLFTIGTSCVAVIAWAFAPFATAQEPNHPQPAMNSNFVPATGQAFYLDLDSAAGAFSKWRHDDLGSLNSMQAVLRVVRLRKDNKWRPTFSIGLDDGHEPAPNSIWLQIIDVDGRGPMKVRLGGYLAGKPIETIAFTTITHLNDELKVVISWAADGIVKVNVGDSESRTIRVPWQVQSAVVAGSTGELKVDRLVLGRISEQTP
jgi:hypothetical protein